MISRMANRSSSAPVPFFDSVSEAVAEELFEVGFNWGPGNGVNFLKKNGITIP